MTSLVALFNQALSRIGQSQAIASLTEASTAARLCRLWHESVRDELLSVFPWPFAGRTATLALVEEEPSTDWLYSYRYPSGCLKVRKLLHAGGRTLLEPIPFAIGGDDQGGLILTDEIDAVCEYTIRIDDPSRWSAPFCDAFRWRIARELVMPMAAKAEFAKVADAGYRSAMIDAQTQAANEEQPDKLPDAEYIRARA